MTITDKQVEAALIAEEYEAQRLMARGALVDPALTMRAALEAAEAARDAQTDCALINSFREAVALVEENYGNGVDEGYWPTVKEPLLRMREVLARVNSAAPSSAEQPPTPRIMIDGVDMTAQIRAAAIKDSSIPAPGAPAADHSPDAGKMVADSGAPEADERARFIDGAYDLAVRWVDAAMLYASNRGTAAAERSARDAFRAALMSCAAPPVAPVSATPFGYVDPAAKYSAAAFAFEPHGGNAVPVYLAPVSARDGDAPDLSELKDYTRDMVGRFFREFAATALKAQHSYSGNGLDWRTHSIESLQRSFVWHCREGDAMDVAVFAAVLWARGAVVTPPADARDGDHVKRYLYIVKKFEGMKTSSAETFYHLLEIEGGDWSLDAAIDRAMGGE